MILVPLLLYLATWNLLKDYPNIKLKKETYHCRLLRFTIPNTIHKKQKFTEIQITDNVGATFHGFMCYSKMTNLRGSDISFHGEFFVGKRKTDVYREGNWIYVIKFIGDLCLVAILLLTLINKKVIQIYF